MSEAILHYACQLVSECHSIDDCHSVSTTLLKKLQYETIFKSFHEILYLLSLTDIWSRVTERLKKFSTSIKKSSARIFLFATNRKTIRGPMTLKISIITYDNNIYNCNILSALFNRCESEQAHSLCDPTFLSFIYLFFWRGKYHIAK